MDNKPVKERCEEMIQEIQNQIGSRREESCRVYIDRNNNIVIQERQEHPVEVLHHPSPPSSPNPRRRTSRGYPPGYYCRIANDNSNLTPPFLRQHAYRQREVPVDERYDYDPGNFLPEKSIEEKKRIFAEFIQEHFKCPVCLDVFVEPMSLSCGHKFCRLCTYKWTCPVCSSPVSCLHLDVCLNDAICGVANYLSTDWQHNYQFLQSYRLCKASPSELAPSPAFNTGLTALLSWNGIFGLLELPFDLFDSVLERYTWLRERCQLTDVVIGMLLVGFAVLLWGFGDQIVDFCQYMYIPSDFFP